MVRIKDVYLQYDLKRTDSFRHNTLEDYNIVVVPETDSSTVVNFEVLVEGKPYVRFEGVEVNPWTQGVGTALVTMVNGRWIKTVQDLLEYAGKPPTASSITFTIKLNTSTRSLTVPVNISGDGGSSDSGNYIRINDVYVYNVITKQRVTEIPINDSASNYRYAYVLSNADSKTLYQFEIAAVVGSNRKQLYYLKNMGFSDGTFSEFFEQAENYNVKFKTVEDFANYIGAKAGDTVTIELVLKPMDNSGIVIKKATTFKLIKTSTTGDTTTQTTTSTLTSSGTQTSTVTQTSTSQGSIRLEKIAIVDKRTKKEVQELCTSDLAKNFVYLFTYTTTEKNFYTLVINAIVSSRKTQLVIYPNSQYSGSATEGFEFQYAGDPTFGYQGGKAFYWVADFLKYIGANPYDPITIECLLYTPDLKTVVSRVTTTIKVVYCPLPGDKSQPTQPTQTAPPTQTTQSTQTTQPTQPTQTAQPTQQYPKTGLPSVSYISGESRTTTTSGPATIELSEDTKNFILVVIGVIAILMLLILFTD